MFSHEKLDLFRAAQWAGLVGNRKEQAEISNSLLAEPTTGPDARKRLESDARFASQTVPVDPDLFRMSVRCRTASASAAAAAVA
jgi:hypothetical protein